MPNDSNFGDIESALKLQQRLCTPMDYIQVMKNARKKNPLIVKTIETSDFKSTATLGINIVNRKYDTSQKNINWLHFKQIKLVKDKPLSIFINEGYNDNFLEVNQKRNPGRPASFEMTCLLKTLWPKGKPISKEKIKDIKSIMKLIPDDCIEVYTTLFYDERVEDDIEGYNAKLDFQIEAD